MSDSPTPTSGSPMFAARDARLTPESVAERTFTQVKRGYAEAEVRAFLRMVSDDMQALRNRDRELTARLQELEDRLARPAPPLSDQDLIVQLGEETARVLSQARDAAVDLRNKAEEHARKVVREAQESARELRSSTQQAVETKTREAEDLARTRAREIVAEARSMRERVLNDLNERRSDLEHQIGELRSNRARLVDMYQVVERALAQAQRIIADEPPAPEVDAPGVAPEPSDGEDERDDTPEPTATSDPSPTDVGDHGDEEKRDVGALFERLKSGSATEESDPEADAHASPPAAEATTTEAPQAATDDELPDDSDDSGDGVDSMTWDDTEDRSLVRRDAVLAPIADRLAHTAKRALQDEQNEMLDSLRRQRGRIDSAKVLPAPDDQRRRWADVVQPAAQEAYAAGATAMNEAVGRVERDVAMPELPGSLLRELVDTVVSPLRRRLESSLETIDAKTPADAEIAVAQRLGARYREWRSQGLDEALGDLLAVAYAQGAYDAAPDGSPLRWVPARVGSCPDCDDNALESTVKGEKFPTGQLHPPAHPGCRCSLALATD